MAVSVSTVADRLARERVKSRERALNLEAASLSLALCLVMLAAAAVYSAKISSVAAPGEAAVNLNRLDATRATALANALHAFPDPAERLFVARQIVQFSAAEKHDLPNVGALARIRVEGKQIDENPSLLRLRERLLAARARSNVKVASEVDVPLLSAGDLRELKPFVVVRERSEFRGAFLFSLLLVIVGFAGAHLARRFVSNGGGDIVLLPLVCLLCGAGLVTMTSIPDPLRDRLLIKAFAQGVAGGCLLLALFNALDLQRSVLRRVSYVPLAAALATSMVLVIFGSGPGGSGAKVNLLGVQPVEAIRVLVVLFLAGYFANRWEFLRALKEDVGPTPVVRWFNVPRLDYALPVIVAMGLVMGFFFLQKDLGPALVIGTLFLAMYAVARRRLVLVLAGFSLLIATVWLGYQLGVPATVAQRIEMWRSPFSNSVRGGDQLAHSLWALSSGGAFGMSPGRGSPDVIPAGATDLVLSAFGEEWGFIGIAAVFLLYVVLVSRALRIALHAPGDYSLFLTLGLTLSLVLQALLIAAGALGLLPLSGVVTPFLSSGRSSMLANFAAVGMLLSVADRQQAVARTAFMRPMRILGVVLAVAGAAVLGKAGIVQVVQADSIVAASALGLQGDGGRRFQYNPRLVAAAATIARGTLFDRNGVPLATSRPEVLAQHRRELAELGAEVATSCIDPERRCYPFGGVMFHLLGDRESGINWAASNTSFEERDSDARLRGFDDHARVVPVRNADGTTSRVIQRSYADLIPFLRSRQGPDSEAVRRITARRRDVRMTIDARLQTKLASIVKRHMEAGHHEHGAVVVLDAESGDLLASVSYPWPETLPALRTAEPINENDDALLDRARYGMYPPGSTFKLVTAAAALRRAGSADDSTFTCARLPDGRVGQRVGGRLVHDDPTDTVPHGALTLQRALVVSCNAYFAQLGMRIGATALHDTATLFGLATATPDTVERLRSTLVDAAYGQGEVLATPFKMARVVAAIASDGMMPAGRWVIEGGKARQTQRTSVLEPRDARRLAQAMRLVVTSGTGRALASVRIPVAGKTGTAEVEGRPSHSWFAGFAPYSDMKVPRRIAFAVLVENGGYGARAAAPIAADLVNLARQLGLI